MSLLLLFGGEAEVLTQQARLRLLYDRKPATWTASAEVATLPARNLNNPRRGHVCRSPGLENPWRLLADFGEVVTLEGLAFVGANFTPDATVRIHLGNNADVWDRPAVTFPFVPWAATHTGVHPVLFGARYAQRYLGLEVIDLANPAGHYELDVVVPSPVFTLPREKPHAFAWRAVDPSPVGYAPSQGPVTEERDEYAEATMEWHGLAEALVFGELQQVLRTCGRKRDIVLTTFSGDPDVDDASRSLNVYGRFTEIPEFEYVGATAHKGNEYDWGPVVFRESR